MLIIKILLPFPKHTNYFPLLTFVLYFLLHSLSAQTPQIDKWKATLSETSDIDARFKLMDDIAWESRDIAPEQTVEYGKKILSLGRKADNAEWVAIAYNRIGIAYKNLDSISNSINYYDSALTVEKSLNSSFGIGRASNQLATLYLLQREFKEARDYAKTAVNYLNKALSETAESNRSIRPRNLKALATANNVLGNTYLEMTRFDSSFIYLSEGLAIRQDLGFKADEAESYLNLSNFYSKMDDDLKLFEFSKKSVEICDSIGGQESILAKALTNLGVASFRMNKLEKAEEYYLRAIKIRQAPTLWQDRKTSYLNLGNLYIIQERFNEAEDLLLKALNEWPNTEKSDSFLPQMNLGHLYLEKSQPKNALKYLTEAYMDMEEPDKVIYPEVIKWLADANTLLDDTGVALKYRTEYAEVKDRRARDYPRISRLEDQVQYQKNKEAMAEKEYEKQQIFIYSLIGGAILLTLLFFTLLRISRLRNKNLISKQNENQQKQRIKELIKEKELEAINAMVEGQENERTRIARDLHDRLGGTLSIVKMHFKSVEESIEILKGKNVKQYREANNLLDEACDEVRKIAHDMTSGVLMKFGLVAALQALKETVETADQLKLNLIDIGLEDRLNYSHEINIYRIIQELLTNTLKHAKASEMNIQLFRKENSLSIVVDDNGIGFDVQDASIFKGIGLKNIESRVYKFDGEINIDSGKGAGTTITIDLPLNEEKS